MDLVNDVRTTKRVLRLGLVETPSHFSLFTDQSSPNLVRMRQRDCTLQRVFPFDDILFRSGDVSMFSINFRVVPNLDVLAEAPQISDPVFTHRALRS